MIVGNDLTRVWASTMKGTAVADGLVIAHEGNVPAISARRLPRDAREAAEVISLAEGATRAAGAGNRAVAEEPDPYRTCFERDRDRILHSAAFRRLAGKTQVFVHPEDHQRTRLTHALEVAQVATAVGRAVGLNVTLLAAMGYGHDVGHTPGAHAGEMAFEAFIPDFHHARWGADVVLAPLNLCKETLDGVRCHSWSLPSPSTAEGHVLSWADRVAYCTHDFEDAVKARIVGPDDLPSIVVEIAGRTRARQINTFVTAIIDCITATGIVGMNEDVAGALAALREFNYERIYMRPESIAQGDAVVVVLQALVEFYLNNGSRIPSEYNPDADALHRAVAYVAGMTDRFAFQTAVELLGWPKERLPRGIDSPYAGLIPESSSREGGAND
jgi:dGTPase